MAEIKSSLEIALERTKNIVADKASLEADEYRKRGKKIISTYMADPEATLDGCFKDIEKAHIPFVKEGMFQALTANLVLAGDPAAIQRVKLLEGGFSTLITENTKKIKMIFEQLEGFFNEYIEGKNRIKEQLVEQYEPRLRKKNEALAKQLGTNVRIDPEADPEFIQILRQNFSRFDEQYNAVVSQVKDELAALFEKENKK